MGILKKITNLVGSDDSAKEEKAKKPRASKAAASDATDAPKKRATKKAAAPKEAAVEAHDAHEGHDHAGHDHGAHEAEAAHKAPQVEGIMMGVGATQYTLMPLITEKGTHVAANNTYLFKAAPHATKGAIKQAIEKLYKVRVTKVRTSRYDGKVVRYGNIAGRRSNFKKVYVTVAEGQSITIHKGV